MNDQTKIALVAFNLTIIVAMLVLWMTGKTGDMGTYGVRVAISLGAGAVVGGLAFLVAKMMSKG